jgi:hypothetical protein
MNLRALTVGAISRNYDILVREMAKRVWTWFMWGDGRDLSDDEQDFIREMMETHEASGGTHPPPRSYFSQD